MKLGAAALGSLAFKPFFPVRNEIGSDGDLVRIGIQSVSIYSRPDDESRIVYTRYRDDLLHMYYSLVSEAGPGYNPVWYRVWGGYIHSGHTQLVRTRLNPVMQKPPEKKVIEVSIAQQVLTAYEGDKIVLQTRISTGLPDNRPNPPGGIPTDTPKGVFNIQNKMPSKHMGDGRVTSDLDAYELPGVPWTCFFEPKTGVATHGTYWHTNYGMTMSHGCVNMRPEEAKWIFRWATPAADPHKIDNIGMGTRVIVG